MKRVVLFLIVMLSVSCSVVDLSSYEDYSPDLPDIPYYYELFGNTAPDNQIFQIMSYVNNYFDEYINDIDSQGVRDYWQTPEESISLRKGDCEDFVILFMGYLKKYDLMSDDFVLLGISYYKNDKLTGHAVLCNKNKNRVYDVTGDMIHNYDTYMEYRNIELEIDYSETMYRAINNIPFYFI